jgi:hypothetical protein
MSEATHYWPATPGRYDIEYRMGNNTYEGWPFEWVDGHWVDVVTRKWWTKDDMIANGYLGVRREPEKPIIAHVTLRDGGEHKPPRNALAHDPDDGNAMVAQEALDQWRTIQHKPVEVERWAYRWAVDLCERLGAS